MSVREKPTVLMARLADVEGEIADMNARPAMCRDQEVLDRLCTKRAAIQRDLNSKHGRQA